MVLVAAACTRFSPVGKQYGAGHDCAQWVQHGTRQKKPFMPPVEVNEQADAKPTFNTYFERLLPRSVLSTPPCCIEQSRIIYSLEGLMRCCVYDAVCVIHLCGVIVSAEQVKSLPISGSHRGWRVLDCLHTTSRHRQLSAGFGVMYCYVPMEQRLLGSLQGPYIGSVCCV